MQLCPQEQTASQDRSVGRYRYQGMSLLRLVGTLRAPLGWLEGRAPDLEEADVWYGT